MRNMFSWCLLVAVSWTLGCGEPAPVQLTPEQIEKQRAEDKVDLDFEDKLESEYQKKKTSG